MDLSLKQLGDMMKKVRNDVNRDLKKADKPTITQDLIASKVGVSLTTISDWEQGKAQPGVLNFIKYCQVLGVSIDDVLGVKKNDFCTCS